MIIVTDNLLKEEAIEKVRQSAIDSGFGTWAPPTAVVGSGKYEGMAWHANHSALHHAYATIMGRPIYPNVSFVRMLTSGTEKRYIHSDRNDGDFTAITYLSDHEEVSGTAFYRHKPTGRLEMPAFQDMVDAGELEELTKQMVEGSDEIWEQTDFIRGLYGRIVIFSAPMFHGRYPFSGIGDNPDNARMIHVSHFYA